MARAWLVARRCVLALGALAVALPAVAPAADVWVRAGAGTDGDGSRERPFADLWRPLNRAARGDVVHVAEGVYRGRPGSGAFVVKVSRLTLVGGYSADFSERDPFRHPTVLEPSPDLSADWAGLPEAILSGQQGTDHRGLVVDGFVLDAANRNAYGADGALRPKQSWAGAALEVSAPDLVVRNCTLLNPYGEGISGVWQGEGNEVSNTLVVNSFHAGISTRSAQRGSRVAVFGCTVAFTWALPGRGGGAGVLVGREGTTTVERTVVAFTQADPRDPGAAVANPFGNDRTVLRENLFYLCQGGLYRYMDDVGQTQVAEDADDLAALAASPVRHALAAASDNRDLDPRLRPARSFFEHFSNFVAVAPGRLDLRRLNQLRAALRLPLEVDPTSPRRSLAPAYPRDQVVPGLVARQAGLGVRVDGPFAAYRSDNGTRP